MYTKKDKSEGRYVKYEFLILRYVPDTVRDEFINVGVILRDLARPTKESVSLTRDWSRVLSLDPDADIEILQAIEREIRASKPWSNDDSVKTNTFNIDFLREAHSNSIQASAPRACLGKSRQQELRNLMRLHVDNRVAPIVAGTGRTAIHKRLRNKLKDEGLLDKLRQRIPTSPYTNPGDPMRIDYGFRKRGVMHLFHAVSLEDELQTAKVLAYSMPVLRKGVLRVEKAPLQMTAVIEPLADIRRGLNKQERMEMYSFAVETMKRQQIRVVTTDSLQQLNLLAS